MRQLLFLLLLVATAAPAQIVPASPRQLYPGLFEAVQLGRVYADGKTFVDALPKAPPAEIMAAVPGRSLSAPAIQ